MNFNFRLELHSRWRLMLPLLYKGHYWRPKTLPRGSRIPYMKLDLIFYSILCCNCGAPIDGTTAAGALCNDCVKLSVDVSEGIQREATLHICRDCERWLQPPASWISAAPESRELLALCLRKLRGLSKVRIIDASFIWTEPHSRRVKVKITIQQEAFQGTILQQTFEVEYVVAYHQCPVLSPKPFRLEGLLTFFSGLQKICKVHFY